MERTYNVKVTAAGKSSITGTRRDLLGLKPETEEYIAEMVENGPWEANVIPKIIMAVAEKENQNYEIAAQGLKGKSIWVKVGFEMTPTLLFTMTPAYEQRELEEDLDLIEGGCY